MIIAPSSKRWVTEDVLQDLDHLGSYNFNLRNAEKNNVSN
jgi:hypothetical protein